MFLAGVIIAVIGTAGIFTAIGMEIATHEPIYKVMMKIFPWIIGLGFLFMGLGA